MLRYCMRTYGGEARKRRLGMTDACVLGSSQAYPLRPRSGAALPAPLLGRASLAAAPPAQALGATGTGAPSSSVGGCVGSPPQHGQQLFLGTYVTSASVYSPRVKYCPTSPMSVNRILYHAHGNCPYFTQRPQAL